MRIMQYLAVFLFVLPVFALGGSKMDGDFEKIKKESLALIDKHIANLNENKACIAAAKDKEGLKTCHSKMRSARREMRSERLELRGQRREERRELRKSDKGEKAEKNEKTEKTEKAQPPAGQ